MERYFQALARADAASSLLSSSILTNPLEATARCVHLPLSPACPDIAVPPPLSSTTPLQQSAAEANRSASLKAEVAALSRALSFEENKCGDLSNKLQETRAAFSALQEAKSKDTADAILHQGAMLDLQNVRDRLQLELQRAEERIAEAGGRERSLNELLSETNQQLSHLRSHNDSLETTITKSHESFSQTEQSLLHRLQEQDARIAELTASLEAKCQRLVDIETSIDALTAGNQEFQLKSNSAESELRGMRKSEVELQEQLRTATQRADALAQQQQVALSELESKHAAIHTEMCEWKRKAEAAEAATCALRKSMAEAETSAQNCSDELAIVTNLLDAHKARATAAQDDLSKEISGLRTQVETTECAIKRLNVENAALVEANVKLKDSADAVETRLQASQAAVQHMHNQVLQVTLERDKGLQENEDARSQLRVVEAELAALRAEQSSVGAAVSEEAAAAVSMIKSTLEKEIATLRESLQKAHNEERETRAELQGRLSDLERLMEEAARTQASEAAMHATQLATALKAKEELTNTNIILTTQLAAAKSQASGAESDRQAVVEELAQAQRETGVLQASLTQEKEWSKRTAADVADFGAQLSLCKSTLHEQEEQAGVLRDSLRNAEGELKAANALVRQVEEASALRLQEKEGLCARLSGELHTLSELHQATLSKLDKQTNEAAQAAAGFTETLARVQTERDACRVQLELAQQAHADLQQQLHREQQAVSSSRLAEAEARQQLEAKVRVFDESSAALAAATASIEALKQLQSEHQAETSQLLKSLSEQRQEGELAHKQHEMALENMTHRADDLQKQVKHLAEALAGQETTSSDLEATVVQLRQALVEVQSRLTLSESKQAAMESACRDLGAERDALKNSHGALQNEVEAFAVQSSEVQVQLTQAVAQQEALAAEKNALQQKMQGMLVALQEGTALQEQLSSQAEELTTELETVKAELRQCRESLIEAATAQTELSARLHEVSEECQQLDERRQELTTRVAELSSEKAALEAALDAANSELNATRELLQSREAAASAEQQRLEESLQHGNAERASLQAALDGVKKDMAELAASSETDKKKLALVVKEIKTSRSSREADETARQNALAQVAELKLTVDKSKARAKRAEEACSDATKTRDEALTKVSLLSDELRFVRTSLGEAQTARKFIEEKMLAFERDAAENQAKSEAKAKALELAGGWEERETNEPCPPMEMTSPVIQSILQSCAIEPARLAEVWSWLKMAAAEDVSRVKPTRLDLDRIPQEARDGMITMILPILKQRKDMRFRLLLREKVEVRTDLRILVEDMRGTVAPPTSKDKVSSWRSTG